MRSGHTARHANMGDLFETENTCTIDRYTSQLRCTTVLVHDASEMEVLHCWKCHRRRSSPAFGLLVTVWCEIIIHVQYSSTLQAACTRVRTCTVGQRHGTSRQLPCLDLRFGDFALESFFHYSNWQEQLQHSGTAASRRTN